MKFRKKPVVIEASLWTKNGDHPHDGSEFIRVGDDVVLSEGAIVRRYNSPDRPGDSACRECDTTMRLHGWIDTREGGHIVCPGDWVITGIEGETYPCKPSVFKDTYEFAG